MNCQNCGKDILVGSNICEHCGSKLNNYQSNDNFDANQNNNEQNQNFASYNQGGGYNKNKIKVSKAPTIFGVLSIIFGLLSPIFGLIFGVIGITTAAKKNEGNGTTINIVGILISIINWLIGYLMVR